MPITKQKDWQRWVDSNQDLYGGTCINVARRTMELLDEVDEFDPHELICRADDESETGGITGFMAGCVAQMVSHCHSRGPEFLAKWNHDIQIGDEGERATEEGKVLNPALVTIGVPNEK